MTTPAAWHAPGAVLEQFARDPGGLDAATAGSLEAHLMACAACRAEVGRHGDPRLASTSWAAIADRIDRPRVSPFEWVLRRLGVRSGPARLAAATPGLRLSGLVAVAGVTALAVLAADQSGTSGPFLLLAPVVPLVAVGLTFAAATEPGGEIGTATPMHGAGLLLRRAVAVLAVSFAVLGAGSLLLADGAGALRWVVPTIAVTLASLALGTMIRLETALAGVATSWLLGVGLLLRVAGAGRGFGDTAPFSASGQWVGVAVALGAALLVGARADRLAATTVRR